MIFLQEQEMEINGRLKKHPTCLYAFYGVRSGINDNYF